MKTPSKKKLIIGTIVFYCCMFALGQIDFSTSPLITPAGHELSLRDVPQLGDDQSLIERVAVMSHFVSHLIGGYGESESELNQLENAAQRFVTMKASSFDADSLKVAGAISHLLTIY